MTEHAVAASDIHKSYAEPGRDPVSVLRGVSIDVARGEFVALMGASGSGKTTLLNLVGGLDTPDRGAIRVEGTDLHALADDARSEFRLRRIGLVFQFFNLLPNLSVRDNVALPLLFLKMPQAEAHARAAEAAAEVGLGDKLARMAHQLSGGEMQRVGIARAIVHRPGLLLADEPTGNLDSRTGGAILELLRRVAADHSMTMVMATHDASAAAAADRTVRMVDGLIVAGA